MSNEQRAANLWNEGLCNSEVPGWSWRRMIAVALDEAEERGRAEVLARVEALDRILADLTEAVGRGDEHGLPEAYRAAVAHLRVADLSPAGTGRADTTGAER